MSETLMKAAPPASYNLAAMTAGLGFMPSLTRSRPAGWTALAGLRGRGPFAPLMWQVGPAPHHVWLAGTRLRMSLIAWAADGEGRRPSACNPPTAIAMLVADAPTRALLAVALAKAACALSLADVDEVLAQLDALALDLAVIEAVREGILDKAKALVRRLVASHGGEPGQERLVRQCGLLLIPVLSRMRARLHVADDCANDVLGALRDMGGARSLLRSCGRIGTGQDGWARMLALWDGPAVGFDLPGILLQTHAFLVAATMGDTTFRP